MSNTATPAPSPPGSAVGRAANAWGQAAIAAGTLSYDPNRFYCRATDVRGHGEKISGRIPPDLYAQVMAMVQNPDFPDYEMSMDVVRDALVHHMAKRQSQIGNPSMREEIDHILHRLAFEEYSIKMAQDVERWERIEERLREALTALQRAGAWGQVWEYLKRGEELADPVPEPYRSAILQLIEEWKPRVPKDFRDDD